MKQLAKSVDKHSKAAVPERWNEGLANPERLKKLLPFLNEDKEYL